MGTRLGLLAVLAVLVDLNAQLYVREPGDLLYPLGISAVVVFGPPASGTCSERWAGRRGSVAGLAASRLSQRHSRHASQAAPGQLACSRSVHDEGLESDDRFSLRQRTTGLPEVRHHERRGGLGARVLASVGRFQKRPRFAGREIIL